jgi:hypothetical protein
MRAETPDDARMPEPRFELGGADVETNAQAAERLTKQRREAELAAAVAAHMADKSTPEQVLEWALAETNDDNLKALALANAVHEGIRRRVAADKAARKVNRILNAQRANERTLRPRKVLKPGGGRISAGFTVGYPTPGDSRSERHQASVGSVAVGFDGSVKVAGEAARSGGPPRFVNDEFIGRGRK